MRVRGEPRSSFLTTPDGKVPPRKPDAPVIKRDPRADISEFGSDAGRNDNPEARGLPERCLFMPTTAGAVMRPVLYNNNYQIVQGKDSVAIWIEMIHDIRTVRIGAKHNPGSEQIRPWLGDSIGWYEGDTLVVETTNFPRSQGFQGSWENLKVTERFRRVAEDRVLYQFTVEDPTVRDKPWGGEYEFGALGGAVYEYACHEGNYSMLNMLAGSREAERKEAAAKRQSR